MQKTKGNSENTPVLYDQRFDSCEIGGNWSLRIITHMADLKELFPDIDIENL